MLDASDTHEGCDHCVNCEAHAYRKYDIMCPIFSLLKRRATQILSLPLEMILGETETMMLN